MQLSYKFRLYPNQKQEQKLLWTLEKCRQVYNAMLEGLNKQNKPNRLALQSQLPKLKQIYPELKGVYSKALQYEVYRLFSNLKALAELKKRGRKVGKLRFKGKGQLKTFTYNQNGFRIIETDKRLGRLQLSKIGDIPVRIHREIEGKIKQVVIKRYSSGKWYVSVCAENENKTAKDSIKKAVGLDVGLRYFLTDTDGKQIENPYNLRSGLEKLKREQRKLSGRKKKSNSRYKQRIKVAKVYEKITNQRIDFLHKISRFYVNNYDVIAIEDLNIKGMVKNHRLARSISDAAWSKFARMLSYKAENTGKIVVKVNPSGTSQEYNYGKIDRDYNASLNILKRGLEKLPQGLRKVTPVEIEPLRKLYQVSASSIIEAGSSLY